MHDQILLTQWHRKRDGEAFHELTRKYASMTYATALRILRSPHDAEEITQRCFETLATNRRAPGDALGPWLHRVAVNAALDWRKRENRRVAREASYHNSQPQSSTPNWDDVYPLVDEAIAALPEKLRRAVVGHYLEQHTHAELAAAEKISREAMTQRIHRGVEQVRATLRKRGVAVPIVALAAMFGDELARAAELPIALKGRLGQIAVSGIAAGGGLGLLPGLLTTTLAKVALVACVAAFWPGYWFWENTRERDAVEDSSIGERIERSVAQKHGAQIIALASANGTELRTAIQPAAFSVESPAPVLAGRVYDIASGRGIEGAEVSISMGEFREKLLTESDGAYSLAELAPGEYRVSCMKANGFYMPNERRENREFRNVVVVPDHPVEGIDLGLERGESIRGRVVNSEGQPVAGATVTGGAEVVNYHHIHTAISSEDGSFTVSGFPPTLDAWVWAETETETSASTGPLIIPVTEPAGVNVVLQPKAAIRGRVVYSSGKPVGGATVYPQYHPSVETRQWETTSDARGIFELASLPPGSLSLHASDGNTSRSDSVSLTLERGVALEDIELLCPLGDASIAGHVVNAQGRRLAVTRVTCMSADFNASIRTDEQGAFEFTGLTPGVYRLEADRFGEYVRAEVSEVATGTTNLEIVLEILPRVTGRVVDAETNEPITKFALGSPMGPAFITHPQTYAPMENENGEFNVQLHSLGENIVAARAEGYALGKVTVTAEKTGEVVRDVEVRMKRQADLHGTVRDESGAGLANATLYSGDFDPSLESDMVACRTAPDGSFVLPASLVAHDYLLVRAAGFPINRIDLTEEDIAGVPIAYTMSRGGSLAVEIYDNGKLSDRGLARLTTSDPMLESTLETVGRLSGEKFLNLGAGEYTLWTTLDLGADVSGPSHSDHIKLAENENKTVRADLRSGTAGLQCGVRVDPSLKPIVAILTLELESGSQLLSTHGTKEEYLFSELPAGNATIRAQIEIAKGGSLMQKASLDLIPGVTTVQDFTFTDTLKISGYIAEYADHKNLTVITFPGELSPTLLASDNQSERPDPVGSMSVGYGGDFSLPGLKESTYTFAAVAYQGDETLWLAYAVVTLGEEDVTVDLQPLP